MVVEEEEQVAVVVVALAIAEWGNTVTLLLQTISTVSLNSSP